MEGSSYLEAIEADDTVSMRNITFSQDFFCFLEEEKQETVVRMLCCEHRTMMC